jgi:hypothetical protein
MYKEVLQQIRFVEFHAGPDLVDEEHFKARDRHSSLDLGSIVSIDPVEYDRRLGLCSIPLYDFDNRSIEYFHRGTDLEAARAVLKQYGIFQYFFPPPDHLALGLAEASPRDSRTLATDVANVPSLGHPFGAFEIVDSGTNLAETIASLKAQGFMVQGEIGLELTESGRAVRSTVKFSPREGIFSKIARVLSIKVDLSMKDLFK